MVRTCCVKGCYTKSHNGKGEKINHGARFFKFPTWKQNQGPQVEDISRRRRMAWVAAVRRKDITFDHIAAFMNVCCRHFHKGQPAYEMLEDDPDWAPSRYLDQADTVCTARSARRGGFVPSEFPWLQQSHKPGRKRGRNKRKRLTDDFGAPPDQPVAWTTNQGQQNESEVVLPSLFEVEVIDQESSRGRRRRAKNKAAFTSLAGETVAHPLVSSEGSADHLAKPAPKVRKGDVSEVIVGKTGERTRTTNVSESHETFGIERRYAVGTWEQATVEAIMSLRLLGTTVTTTQVAQTTIANLKDANDFLRAHNDDLRSELKAKQWTHEQEVRDLQERLETWKQKCSCGAVSETTDSGSEAAPSDVMAAEIKTEPDVSELDLQGNSIY